MVKASIKEIYETLKTMLSYAMALSESNVPTVYELGHYLADNILTKVCLAVAINKSEEQQTSSVNKSGKKWTYGLPQLYNDHLKKHYPVPDYDSDIKEMHDDRNVYQHDVDSFDMTMRRPRAKAYVELVEDIMRTVGIIRRDEIITPSLLSPFRGYDYAKQQIKTKAMKYQVLHDLFKEKHDDDLYIKFGNSIKKIHDLKDILNMIGGESHGMRYFHNSKWDINISSYGVSINSSDLKKGYALNEPNQDDKVLEHFLQYFRECCEKVGMNIKP
jgi:hypothetical protein